MECSVDDFPWRVLLLVGAALFVAVPTAAQSQDVLILELKRLRLEELLVPDVL
jgi:hypothetical protein